MLIIAYHIINGLRHRLMLFGEVKVVIAEHAVEYGAGLMQVCGLTAGDTIAVLPVG
jgi:succinate dehydrogenase/fumarate reductase cytochrome b subunit